MDHRALRAGRAALVVALVVLAGCGGFLGADGGAGADGPPASPDVTPAPVPNESVSSGPTAGTGGPAGTETDGAPTRFPNAPPGINATGFTDYSALVESHFSVLADRSYTVVVTRAGDLPADALSRYEVAVQERGQYLVRDGATGTSLVYTDATGTFERGFDASNGTLVDVGEEVTVSSRYASWSVLPDAAHFSASAADVELVTRDGAVYYRVHATEPPDTLAGTVRNYSLTVYVRSDGLVRSVALRYDRDEDGTRSRVDRRWTYTRIGNTSVAEPGWVTRVKRDRGIGPQLSTPAGGRGTESGGQTGDGQGTTDGRGTGDDRRTANGRPPGVGPDGLHNASVLWAAHRSVLANRSFTLDRSVEGPPAHGFVTGTVAVENRSTYRAESIDGNVTYSDPTGTYVRQPLQDERRNYRIDFHPPTPYLPNRYSAVRSPVFGVGFLEANGSSVSRVERNGTTYHRIRVSRAPERLWVDDENYSATALVRGDGLVRRIRVSFTMRADVATSDSSTRGWVEVTYEFRYHRIGSTNVTEPAWVTRRKRYGNDSRQQALSDSVSDSRRDAHAGSWSDGRQDAHAGSGSGRRLALGSPTVAAVSPPPRGRWRGVR